MLKTRRFSNVVIAGAFAIIGALSPSPASVQAPKQPPKAAPARPYKAVAIKPPIPLNDASFKAFRKQLAGIAEKKDRDALARLVAANFFWTPDDKDLADESKPAIDNLAKAMGLDATESYGWETLAYLTDEASASPNRQRPGVVCAPAPPTYDKKAFEELTKATRTDPSEWAYLIREGVEVRASTQERAAVVERLGLHVVRVLQEAKPASEQAVKVATPSGKTGYIEADAMRDLAGLLICYVKEAGGWKIAGYLGGAAGDSNGSSPGRHARGASFDRLLGAGEQ